MRTPPAMLTFALALGLTLAAVPLPGLSVQGPADAPPVAEAPGRFIAVPIYIDPHGTPLAAYQFQLDEAGGRMRVVGVENGEHPAFADAPFFDRDAVNAGRADRIIVAAYSTHAADALPTRATRVATVHVHFSDDAEAEPDWRLTLVRAGDADARPIDATLATHPEPGG